MISTGSSDSSGATSGLSRSQLMINDSMINELKDAKAEHAQNLAI